MAYASGAQNFPIRNVYPTAPGGTLGQASSAASPYMGDLRSPTPAASSGATGPMSSGSEHVDKAIAVSSMHKPLPYWIALLAVVILLGWVTRHYGDAETDFKSIRVSAYNILIISLAAIVGISFLKTLLTYIPIPGLTTVVLNG